MEKSNLRALTGDALIALGINLIFGLLAWRVYALLDQTQLTDPMVLGFAALWAVMLIVSVILYIIGRRFRLNLYDRSTLYLSSNVLASALPLLFFAAFVALQTHQAAADSGTLTTIVLFVIGFLACYAAHIVVTVFFRGTIYVLVNWVVVLGSYVVFVLWPAAAQILVGRFIAP